MTFGEKIQYLRKQKELTQAEVAEEFHVSRGTISSWEVGRTYPDLALLVRISDFFGVSLDILLREDEIMVATMTKEMKVNRWWRKVGIGIILTFCFLMCYAWLYLSFSKSQISNYLNSGEVIVYETSIIGKAPIEEVTVRAQSKLEWRKKPHIETQINKNGIVYLHLTQRDSLVGKRNVAVSLKGYVSDDKTGASLSLARVDKIITVNPSKEEEIIWEKE